MRDELFDRDFQNGRDALNQGIDRLLSNIMNISRAMTAIQFAAPWKDKMGKPHKPASLPQ